MKKIILDDEDINDLLVFLNRTNIGFNNAIGETQTFLRIVKTIENSESIEKESDKR